MIELPLVFEGATLDLLASAAGAIISDFLMTRVPADTSRLRPLLSKTKVGDADRQEDDAETDATDGETEPCDPPGEDPPIEEILTSLVEGRDGKVVWKNRITSLLVVLFLQMQKSLDKLLLQM